jgi:hypothetical protein
MLFWSKDLSSIFGLDSHFGAVLGEDSCLSLWVRSYTLDALIYQRLWAAAFSDIDDGATPA